MLNIQNLKDSFVSVIKQLWYFEHCQPLNLTHHFKLMVLKLLNILTTFYKLDLDQVDIKSMMRFHQSPKGKIRPS